MRIAIDTQISASRDWWNWEAGYLDWLPIIRQRPEHHFYLLLPSIAKIETDSNVTPIPLKYTSSYYDAQVVSDDFWYLFNARTGLYPIDAVLTARPSAVTTLVKMLASIKHRKMDIPVFIIDPGVHDMDLEPLPETEHVLRACGYATGHNIFVREGEQMRAIRTAKKYLSPSFANRIEERGVVIPYGIEYDSVEKSIKEVGKNNVITLFYGGRLNKAKSIDEVFDAFEMVYRSGRQVRFVMTSQMAGVKGISLAKDLKKRGVYNYIETYFGCAREDYLKRCAEAHVMYYPARDDGFPVGLFEAIGAGLIVIFRDCEWVQECIGFDYPFIAVDEYDAQAMLLHVLDNYDESVRLVEPFAKKYRDMYNAPIVFEKLFEFIEGVVTKTQENFSPTPQAIRMLNKIAGKLIVVTWAHVLQWLTAIDKRWSVNLKTTRFRGEYVSRWELYHTLKKMGYEDDCKQSLPNFVRRNVNGECNSCQDG